MSADTSARVPLEPPGPLSQSLIWSVQRAGYRDTGIDAWRKDLVPQYVTSNPFNATSCARIVRRYLGEVAADEPGDRHGDDTVTIVELGAGSGQFAFHFVRVLQELCRRGRPVPPFRYVLTDFADANRAAWVANSALRPYLDEGLAAIAGFDVESDTELRLDGADVIGPTGPRRHGVVIANYLFDAVPQDCFTLSGDRLHEVYCAAQATAAAARVTPGNLLDQVSLDFTTVPIEGDRYAHDAVNRVLAGHAAEHGPGMFLFPGVVLECLERLKRIFDRGLLLLSADKGLVRRTDRLTSAGPSLMEHGPIFSMTVDYDAIGRWFEVNGGIAIHPPRRATSLTLSFGAVGFEAGAVAETAAAFEDCVDALNPDDFFTLQSSLNRAGGELDADGAMALLRLSGWDSDVLVNHLGAFSTALQDLHGARVDELVDALERVWERYYPVDPDSDVGVAIATLLYSMGLHAEAVAYLEKSLQTFGPSPRVLYDLAMCHIALQDPEAALSYADRASAADPTYRLPAGVRRWLEASQPE